MCAFHVSRHTLKSGIDGSLLGVSFIFIGVAVFTEMIGPLYTPISTM